jgi:hypothetical protein
LFSFLFFYYKMFFFLKNNSGCLPCLYVHLQNLALKYDHKCVLHKTIKLV